MSSLKSFTTIMEKKNSKNKLKGSSEEVDIIYEVFKDTGLYMSPELSHECSKTATEIAYYICKTIKRNQTSIKFDTTDLIESPFIKSKSRPQIHNSIKELIKLGAIVRWKDIKLIPNTDHISKSWYLLNPQMIKNIGCQNFRQQVEVTVRCIELNNKFIINEFSAIVYNFNNKENGNIESKNQEASSGS